MYSLKPAIYIRDKLHVFT